MLAVTEIQGGLGLFIFSLFYIYLHFIFCKCVYDFHGQNSKRSHLLLSRLRASAFHATPISTVMPALSNLPLLLPLPFEN